ncbi:MAG: hypothetical protein Q7S09_05975 [bacterium]|nr:hypothetical protein [bacterium]
MVHIVKFFEHIAERLSFFGRRKKRSARFKATVIFDPEELDEPALLPPEFRFILNREDIKRDLKEVLGKKGGDKGIAIRTKSKTPEHVLRAIDHIAVLTQHRCITSWLPPLLKFGKRPVFTPSDHARAKERGIDLYQELAYIVQDASQFKRFMILDEENIGINKEECEVLDRMNGLLVPFRAEYAVNRMVFDNAHERTHVAQAIIKVMFVVGPITHVLEKFSRGIGKVFAASVDDVMSETAELMALRGSGFTWKELARRGKILIPVFILATYGAFKVETLIEHGWLHLAGAVFGLSAVALSLTTALQSIRMYKDAVRMLVAEGKLEFAEKKPKAQKRAIFWEAVRQDFTNPARLGLFLGACASPIVSMTVFSLIPGFVHNGWILAFLGATETIVAGITVYLSGFINERMFRRNILKTIARLPRRA